MNLTYRQIREEIVKSHGAFLRVGRAIRKDVSEGEEAAGERCSPKHRRELYVSGASNRRQWRKVRQERNPSMAYPLGQPLDSLPTFFLLYLASLRARARARACPTRPFRIRIPRLSSFRRIYIYSFPLSTRTSLSLSRYPSLDGRLQGQPLVNLIISATPDKRRRQNVIPARSRSPFLVSNSKWCRCDLTHPYHIVGRGRFLSPAVPQSYSDFLSVRSFRTPSTFRRHPSIAPLTR